MNVHRAVVLAPSVREFRSIERAEWHFQHLNCELEINIKHDAFVTKEGHHEPTLLFVQASSRYADEGSDKGLLTPPTESGVGSEIWFFSRRQRIVFVIDTSPSMFTLRGSNGVPPLSEVGEALADCFQGLAHPMGSLRQEVFVSVVALIHTDCSEKQYGTHPGAVRNRRETTFSGRYSVVNLVQGFCLSGSNSHSTNIKIPSKWKHGNKKKNENFYEEEYEEADSKCLDNITTRDTTRASASKNAPLQQQQGGVDNDKHTPSSLPIETPAIEAFYRAKLLSDVVINALERLEARMWESVECGKFGERADQLNNHGKSKEASDHHETDDILYHDEILLHPGIMPFSPKALLEPMIEAGVFALRWLPPDATSGIVLVTDGVCRDKQLLTTYDGMIMQLCRRDITLHVLQIGSVDDADSCANSPLGMVADIETLARLCEITGGGLYNPKLVKSLIRVPSTLSHGHTYSSYGGGHSSIHSSNKSDTMHIDRSSGSTYGSESSIRWSHESSTLLGTVASNEGGDNDTDGRSSLYVNSNSNSIKTSQSDSSTLSGEWPKNGIRRDFSSLQKVDRFASSAFQQAFFFRLSPLSIVETEKRIINRQKIKGGALSSSSVFQLSSSLSSRNELEMFLSATKNKENRSRYEETVRYESQAAREFVQKELQHNIMMPLSTELGFRFFLQRFPLQRYTLPRICLHRIVGMRNSEGFKLLEAKFDYFERARMKIDVNNDKRIGEYVDRDISGAKDYHVTFVWSLRWQVDVLLEYSLNFIPAKKVKQQEGHSVILSVGEASVHIDVVCNASFQEKLKSRMSHSGSNIISNLDSANATATLMTPLPISTMSKLPSDRPRDKIFNDPAVQLMHFITMLRQVDEMLVQLCSVFLYPLVATKKNHHSQRLKQKNEGGRTIKDCDATYSKEEDVNIDTITKQRYVVIGQLSVRDWHRWFEVIYFEVWVQTDVSLLREASVTPGLRLYSEQTAMLSGNDVWHLSDRINDESTDLSTSFTNKFSKRGGDRVRMNLGCIRGLSAREELISRLREWCFAKGQSGQVLRKGILYLRHIYSDSVSPKSRNSSLTGFCIIKLSWNLLSGGLASFHLGFFNTSVTARIGLVEDLHLALMCSSHKNTSGGDDKKQLNIDGCQQMSSNRNMSLRKRKDGENKLNYLHDSHIDTYSFLIADRSLASKIVVSRALMSVTYPKSSEICSEII